jgi:hypothetical protein
LLKIKDILYWIFFVIEDIFGIFPYSDRQVSEPRYKDGGIAVVINAIIRGLLCNPKGKHGTYAAMKVYFSSLLCNPRYDGHFMNNAQGGGSTARWMMQSQ